MPVAYLPVQDRFQLSCTAARKLPVKVFFKKWQGQYDLNSQPTVLETVALPVELYPFFALKQKSTASPKTPASPPKQSNCRHRSLTYPF